MEVFLREIFVYILVVFVLTGAQLLELPNLTPALKIDVSAVENDTNFTLSVDNILLTPSIQITTFPSNLPVVQNTKFENFLNNPSVNVKPIDVVLPISSSVFNGLNVSPSNVLVEKNTESKSSTSIVFSSSRPIQKVETVNQVGNIAASVSRPTPSASNSASIVFSSSRPIQKVETVNQVGNIAASVSISTPSASNKQVASSLIPTTKPVVTPKTDILFNQSCIEKDNMCFFKPACACQQYKQLNDICAIYKDENVCDNSDTYQITRKCSFDLSAILRKLRLKVDNKELLLNDTLQLLENSSPQDLLIMNSKSQLIEVCNSQIDNCPKLQDLINTFYDCDESVFNCSSPNVFCVLTGTCILKSDFANKCKIERETCKSVVERLCTIQLPKLKVIMQEKCVGKNPKSFCNACLDKSNLFKNVSNISCAGGILDALQYAYQKNLAKPLEATDYILNLFMKQNPFSYNDYSDYFLQLRDKMCATESKQCSLMNEFVNKLKCKKQCIWDLVKISSFSNSSIITLNKSLFASFVDYVNSLIKGRMSNPEYEQQLYWKFLKLFDENCTVEPKSVPCEELNGLLMTMTCKSCQPNSYNVTANSALNVLDWQNPDWLAERGVKKCTSGTRFCIFNNECVAEKSYDTCYKLGITNGATFCQEVCQTEQEPTLVTKRVLQRKMCQSNFKMEGTKLNDVILQCLMVDSNTLDGLKFSVINSTCQPQIKATVISRDFLFVSSTECKVMLNASYSTELQISFDIDLRKSDCKGIPGGSGVLQCGGLCMTSKVECGCPQNQILSAGSVQCCGIPICSSNGRCYYNNSCANSSDPCAVPNKCGICVGGKTGKDFSSGIDEKCGICKSTGKQCAEESVYITQYWDLMQGNVLAICLSKDLGDSEIFLTKSTKQYFSLKKFKGCPVDDYANKYTVNCSSYLANQPLVAGVFNLTFNNKVVGEITIPPKQPLSINVLQETVEMGDTVSLLLTDLKMIEYGRCCIKYDDKNSYTCKKPVNGLCSETFCTPGKHSMVFQSCSGMNLIEKIVNVNCSVPDLSYSYYQNRDALFFKCPLNVKPCQGWKVVASQYLLPVESTVSSIKQKCITSCFNQTGENEIKLPKKECKLETIPPKRISQCQNGKIWMCIDESVSRSVKSDNKSSEAVLKISERCMVISQSKIKNGDKFRICATDDSCCQEHTFEVDAVILSIRSDNHFFAELSCGKPPESGHSWKLSVGDQILYESKDQIFKLNNEWQFKYIGQVGNLSLSLLVDNVMYNTSYEIQLGTGELEILGLDKGGCKDGDQPAFIPFRVAQRPYVDETNIVCNGDVCKDGAFVPCGGSVTVCATVQSMKVCKQFNNNKEPAPPLITCKEQGIGFVCFVYNLESIMNLTINGNIASKLGGMVYWIEKSSVAKITIKSDTPGIYNYLIEAVNSVASASENVEMVVKDKPYLCDISIEPHVGIAMDTLFSIKLSNDSSATNTLLEIQKNGDDFVWSIANTDLVSLKFPSDGNFSLKFLVRNDFGKTMCNLSILINDTEKGMADLATETLNSLTQISDASVMIDTAFPLYARLSTNVGLDQSEADAMNAVILEITKNLASVSDQVCCKASDTFSNKPKDGKPLETSKLTRKECSSRISSAESTVARKRRSLSNDTYYPFCNPGNLTDLEVAKLYISSTSKAIFPLNEDTFDERQEFLAKRKTLLESLCNSIVDSGQSMATIIDENVEFYCYRVTDTIHNSSICFSGFETCVYINSSTVNEDYASWDCQQDGHICEGYFIGAIIFFEDVMSKQPNGNFTFDFSIEAYILNPMKSCIMEDESIQDLINIEFPKNDSAICIRYDTKIESWTDDNFNQLTNDQTSICNSIFPGPVALALENVPDEQTTTATIATTAKTATTKTTTTKSVTANKIPTTTYTETTRTQNGSDTSYEKNITKNFKLIYKVDFHKTVTDLGGFWNATDAFCKSWLSRNQLASINCSISEGSIIVSVQITGPELACNQYKDLMVSLISNGSLNLLVNNVWINSSMDSFITIEEFTTTQSPEPDEPDDPVNRSYIVLIVVVVIIVIGIVIIVVFIALSKHKKRKIDASPNSSMTELKQSSPFNHKKRDDPRKEPGISNHVFEK